MPHFGCLACNTRVRGPAGEPIRIGDLCPVRGSLVEPVGDLRETGGTALSRHAGSTLHGGASGAGRLIAGRVGEIIARREFKHALIRLEIERYDANSVSPQVEALSTRAPGTGDAPVRRRRLAPLGRAAVTVARLSMPGAIGANGAARRRFTLRPRRRPTQRRGPV
jgi:hypothetical protein